MSLIGNLFEESKFLEMFEEINGLNDLLFEHHEIDAQHQLKVPQPIMETIIAFSDERTKLSFAKTCKLLHNTYVKIALQSKSTFLLVHCLKIIIGILMFKMINKKFN